jgi:hypothetical protein
MQQFELNREWALWFDIPKYHNSYKEFKDINLWKNNIKKIYTFKTVEMFWRTYNNIFPVSEIELKNGYYLFQSNIMPTWNDLHNLDGGIITFTIHKNQLDKINSNGQKLNIDDIWQIFVLSVIGENFTEEQIEEEKYKLNGISIKNFINYYEINIFVSNDIKIATQKKILNYFKFALEENNSIFSVDISDKITFSLNKLNL